ncbi:MAG: hypothetical protein ABSH41_28865 [Syntrophobacteraceae bacterium]
MGGDFAIVKQRPLDPGLRRGDGLTGPRPPDWTLPGQAAPG